MKLLKILFRKLIFCLLVSIRFFLKKDVIILHSHDFNSYNSNTKYLFEYLSNNKKNTKVFYLTESEQIKEYFEKISTFSSFFRKFPKYFCIFIIF